MTVTNIQDDHHVVRHCKARQYFLKDGKIIPYPSAFHLKPATLTAPAEDSLSAVYYEWFDGTHAEKMKACCHFIRMEIKNKDALLRLSSGLIKKQGLATKQRLRVTHEPNDDCQAYAAIRGLTLAPNDELCALLATVSLIDAFDRSTIDAL